MKNASRILLPLLAILALATGPQALAAVTATLERDHVAPDETVRLLLQRDGRGSSEPDTSALKRDFDILGRSSGSSVQIINGHVNSRTQVTLTLAPKHPGTIAIPALPWDGEQSPALQLTVGASGQAADPGAAASAASAHVFVTATLDRPQAYVQSVVVLTLRLHTDQPLYHASLELPASSDILVKQLGEDRQTQETQNGRSYQVIERKYLLFPQRSGRLVVDGAVLDAQVADQRAADPFSGDPFGGLALPRMTRSTRPLRLHAQSLELKVLPRPAAATGALWLPAQTLSLSESWTPQNATVHVGEPLARRLQLSALGLSSSQLPDLATLMALPDAIKAYPDQARLDDKAQGDSVLGSRDQSVVLIASRPGHYVLPALKLGWWDAAHNVAREALLPQREVDVLPALAGAAAGGATPAAATPAAQPSSPPSRPNVEPPRPAAPIASVAAIASSATSPWPWVSGVLALFWLATLGAWWFSRRRAAARSPAPAPSGNPPAAARSDPSFKAFQAACRASDAPAARASLLAWAGGVWPEHPALGLNALGRLLEQADVAEALRELDRACYAGGEWNGALLARLLAVAPAPAARPPGKASLPGLYP